MPNIVWTLLVAAATAVVTALATGLFVTPAWKLARSGWGTSTPPATLSART
ncbi:hypothetical protein ACFQ0Q_48390 [Streptomyces aureus]